MEELIVLGGGASGLAFIQEARDKDKDRKITLIDKNKHSFGLKAAIKNPGNIEGVIQLEEWTKTRQIEFIEDKVERINPRSKKIFLKEKEPLNFAKLVVASGLVSKKIPVKGEHRDGFLYLSDIDPVKLKDLLNLSSETVVYVSSSLGLDLALALRALDKEVRIVCANLDFLAQDQERIIAELEEKGIVLHLDCFIEEAVGEGIVRAAKLSPLKIVSAQIVFIDSGFVPNLSFFEEEVNSPDIQILNQTNKQEVING